MRRLRRMIFKIGLTVVILAAVATYYMLQSNEDYDLPGKVQHTDRNGDHHDVARNLGVGKSKQRVENEHESESKNDHQELEKGNGDSAELKISQKNEKQHVRDSDADSHRHEEIVIDSVVIKQPKDITSSNIKHDQPSSQKLAEPTTIHLSVVACGDRVPETVVMLKSARLLTHSPLHFHIFAEDKLHDEFKHKLDAWPANIKATVTYTIQPITYPKDQNAEEWKKLFKPCATQRLFLPYILDVDSLIYVDTDILFMRPLEDLWAHFSAFNSSQAAALAPEHEDPGMGWYNRFARHPYYGKLGVNSGVMLMNLTRLRNAEWIENILKYYKEYRLRITWGDQDLINIYFHFFPDGGKVVIMVMREAVCLPMRVELPA